MASGGMSRLAGSLGGVIGSIQSLFLLRDKSRRVCAWRLGSCPDVGARTQGITAQHRVGRQTSATQIVAGVGLLYSDWICSVGLENSKSADCQRQC